MSEYDQDYEDYYYDDGRLCDDNEYEAEDEFGIPTYDELDLEGRYYTYGSRQDYNEWRYQQIQALRLASQSQTAFVPQKSPNIHFAMRHEADELYDSKIKTYLELSKKEKANYSSRDQYNNWRNDFIKRKRNEQIQIKAKKELLKETIQWICAFTVIIIFVIWFIAC